MLKRLTFLIVLVFAFCAQASDVKFFRTYEDYQKGVGDMLKGVTYSGHNYVIGKGLRLNFTKNGEETEMKAFEFWGFTYDNVLFRTYGKGKFKLIVRLVSSKKIHYYENGLAHLEMVARNTTYSKVDLGVPFAFSFELNSDLIQSSELKGATRNMPQYKAFVKCIKKTYDFVEEVRQCVKDFDEE